LPLGVTQRARESGQRICTLLKAISQSIAPLLHGWRPLLDWKLAWYDCRHRL